MAWRSRKNKEGPCSSSTTRAPPGKQHAAWRNGNNVNVLFHFQSHFHLLLFLFFFLPSFTSFPSAPLFVSVSVFYRLFFGLSRKFCPPTDGKFGCGARCSQIPLYAIRVPVLEGLDSAEPWSAPALRLQWNGHSSKHHSIAYMMFFERITRLHCSASVSWDNWSWWIQSSATTLNTAKPSPVSLTGVNCEGTYSRKRGI